ncbi:MAG: hypothetical protein K1X91_01900 [Bacteriodetes bacterium]|nr:hypothetical protein [Bacteroidota bacterium]
MKKLTKRKPIGFLPFSITAYCIAVLLPILAVLHVLNQADFVDPAKTIRKSNTYAVQAQYDKEDSRFMWPLKREYAYHISNSYPDISIWEYKIENEAQDLRIKTNTIILGSNRFTKLIYSDHPKHSQSKLQSHAMLITVYYNNTGIHVCTMDTLMQTYLPSMQSQMLYDVARFVKQHRALYPDIFSEIVLLYKVAPEVLFGDAMSLYDGLLPLGNIQGVKILHSNYLGDVNTIIRKIKYYNTIKVDSHFDPYPKPINCGLIGCCCVRLPEPSNAMLLSMKLTDTLTIFLLSYFLLLVVVVYLSGSLYFFRGKRRTVLLHRLSLPQIEVV